MNLAEFQASQSQTTPPAGLSLALQALWFDTKGDWNQAHELAQMDGGPAGDWVHAYLHRKEGERPQCSVLVRTSEKARSF